MHSAIPFASSWPQANVNDIVQAEDLISGLSFDKLLADKGFDSDRFRGQHRPGRRRGRDPIDPLPIASHPVRQAHLPGRNLVERFFNKIKHFRRIATRYEKTALSFAAMLFLVGAVIWLR